MVLTLFFANNGFKLMLLWLASHERLCFVKQHSTTVMGQSGFLLFYFLLFYFLRIIIMNMIKKTVCVAACLAASTCWAGFTVANHTASDLAVETSIAFLPGITIPSGASQDVSHGFKWNTIFQMIGTQNTLTVTFNKTCSVVLVKSKTDQDVLLVCKICRLVYRYYDAVK